MKKIGFVLFMVFISTVTFSQVRFGIVANPHLAWMTPDVKTVTSEGVVFGVSGGLNMDFQIGENENYSFSTGILLNKTGGKLKFGTALDTLPVLFNHSDIEGADSLPAGTIVTYNLQYIQVPLSLKFKTNEIGFLKYFMVIGLTTQVNVKAIGTADANNITDVKINDEVKLFGLGYHIGAGIEYSLGGNTSFIAGVTFTSGFSDITNDDARKDDTRDMKKDKTTLNNIALKVGILF